MSYRNRQYSYDRPLKTQDRNAVHWAVLAVVLANLGPLIVRALKHFGFHASKMTLTVGTIAVGALCVVGGLMAYREARRTAARHLAELTGNVASEHAPDR